MNAPVYRLRWRGSESGPYPLSALEQMLEAGQICLWHEVFHDDRWVALEQVLPPAPPSQTARLTPGHAPQQAVQAPAASHPPTRVKLPRLHNRPPPEGGARTA